jgi:acetolactate synthase-1/2/3 large subunit
LIKLSDYVMQFVARAGVKHLFMLTGGACMHLVDSAGRNKDLEYVCCLHEQACAFAAEAYAEYSGHLSACLVTTGPGSTNTLTGVAAAWLESASCLFLSGQAKRADMIGNRGVRSMGQQEIDILSMVRPITKYAVSVQDPRSVRYELEKAIHLATHGRRGPVWIEIPLDVQAAMVDETGLQGYVPEPPRMPAALASQVDAAIDLLNRAERPVLFLGNGARAALAGWSLNTLIERLQIPVLLTWKTADVLAEAHPLFAGRPGAIGQRFANFTQQNADCLMVIGARLDLPQTAFNHVNFARGARKIMVDVDQAEIAKMQTTIDVPVCADSRDFITEFLRRADRLKPSNHTAWIAQCKHWQRTYPVVLPEYRDDPAGTVNTYVLVDELSRQLSADDVLVPGSSGPCSDIFLQAFRVSEGQRVVNAPGLGAMGTGLPGTIGACLASGRKRVVCVVGDGGFQLNIQELETVRRLNLPIKYFVLCNGGYAAIMSSQRNYFESFYVGSDPSSHLTLPDVTKVAEAYGIATASIDSHAALQEQVRAVLAHDGPIVCAVATSSLQPTAPRVTSTVGKDGVIVSRPMEDMWPLLSREELEANMLRPIMEQV